ncbi:MAG: hypothetical protein A3K19_25855 [Lentisphaerae bacterium RIFOXYB12_FULL_65_16]|nr:MAG: hypothetical protein A3K18_31855 [Lentisphaerae bacterium RIFOXYA12_64_32]OGV91396.1 MAG: hypothetical protein A3K19_25855 [Lentisphaerae bacterium RIFOXYB12_FULL_65_16]
MVAGLDRFREHFRAFSDRYVLIGGAPAVIRRDLQVFLEGMEREDVDMKALGLGSRAKADVLVNLREFYGLE